MRDFDFYDDWCEYNKHNPSVSFATFCYNKGKADEQKRVMSIVIRCIASNVYNVTEGIELLNEIKKGL